MSFEFWVLSSGGPELKTQNSKLKTYKTQNADGKTAAGAVHTIEWNMLVIG